MTKTGKSIIIVAVILLLSSLISIGSVGSSYELRDSTLEILFDGLIQSICLIVLTSLVTIKYFKKHVLLIIFVSIPLILFFILCGWLCVMWPFTTIKDDMVIYQNSDKSNDYIIFQYYETGIGGNPHTRVIRTTHYRSIIRFCEELDKNIKPGSLSFEDPKWKSKVPVKIVVSGCVFSLLLVPEKMYD